MPSRRQFDGTIRVFGGLSSLVNFATGIPCLRWLIGGNYTERQRSNTQRPTVPSHR